MATSESQRAECLTYCFDGFHDYLSMSHSACKWDLQIEFIFSNQAAVVRAVGKPLLAIWERHMNSEEVVHKQIHLAMKLSVKAEELLDTPHTSHRLPPAVSEEIKRCLDGMLSMLSAIRSHYNSEGRLLFNYTIKHHYLQHVALRISRLTARSSWCYSGENFMHIIKRIVAASVKGCVGVKSVNKATQKFAAGMAISIFGLDAMRM